MSDKVESKDTKKLLRKKIFILIIFLILYGRLIFLNYRNLINTKVIIATVSIIILAVAIYYDYRKKAKLVR